MRTTIRLDADLLSRAKRTAQESGRTLTAVIEDALREALARGRAEPKRARARLPTFKGDGLLPGVDLDDNGSMIDRMDRS
jgi:hypothetical protein